MKKDTTTSIKVYNYMADIADRRSKEYKALERKLDNLTSLYGKESKEVNDFFESDLGTELGSTDLV